MSNPTRDLGRVAPCAAPVGPVVPTGTGRRPRTPEAAVPSEDPSASGRSGESRTYAPAATPDAPRRRDDQKGREGPHGRADGPATGDGGHPPPRTAGTPRA